MIEELFCRLANEVDLPDTIRELADSDRGFFLGLPEKNRPITISNFFSKLMWKIAMRRSQDFFPPQNVTGTVALLQRAAQEPENRILKLDGANAFQCMKRSAIFEAIQGYQEPLLQARWNSCYGKKTPIHIYDTDGNIFKTWTSTTGVRAGCVSASKFFQKALEKAESSIQGAVMIVDDIHIIKRGMSFADIKKEASEQLAYTGVAFFGPKTREIECRTPGVQHTLGTCVFVGEMSESDCRFAILAKLKPTGTSLRKSWKWKSRSR
jgi:hypothetical protein